VCETQLSYRQRVPGWQWWHIATAGRGSTISLIVFATADNVCFSRVDRVTDEGALNQGEHAIGDVLCAAVRPDIPVALALGEQYDQARLPVLDLLIELSAERDGRRGDFGGKLAC
jgi:hypothetical protein